MCVMIESKIADLTVFVNDLYRKKIINYQNIDIY